MEDILLVHRKSNPNSDRPLSGQGVVWKTCLRQILFIESASFDFTAEAEDQILRGQEALNFLLEVLCGLHSPVLGETEVLGQFKNFIQSRRDAGDFLFSENQKWLQFLMAEVKRVRSDFVNGLGSNSYGSLIRRHTRDHNSITLLGAGQLVSEILPWVALKQNLQVVSRAPEKLQVFADKWPHLQLETYQQMRALNEVLVVAAPLEDLRLSQLLQQQGPQVRVIYDLRGEVNRLPELVAALNAEIQVISLADLFSALEESRKENQEKIKSIKKVISERVVQFMERSELRPMGWDDLCA